MRNEIVSCSLILIGSYRSFRAAAFEKANTYVFAAPNIRDREVGGSNPLAPTRNIDEKPLAPSGFSLLSD